MGNCELKAPFFNPEEYTNALKGLIYDACMDVEDEASIKKRTLKSSEFTENFYHRLIELLKSEDTSFSVEYSSDFTEGQKKLYKKGFEALKQILINGNLIPVDYKNNFDQSRFESLIEKELQSDFGATRLKFSEKSEESTFDIELEGAADADPVSEELNLNEYITEVYGNCFGAIKQMRNLFSRDIFTYTMCNFENGFFVTNKTELNRNIAIYKNLLFKRLTKFLSTKYPEHSYPNEIYTLDKSVHRRYYDALNDMRDYLKSIKSSETISDEYSTVILGGLSEELDAINAYTILKYFDSLMMNALGKTIKVDTRYKNSEVTLDAQKYEFSKDTEHLRKSWNDSENRTAVQNSSRFSKFVLDSIPLKVKGKDTGKSIGSNRLSATISKLFGNVSYLSTSSVAGVSELVSYLHAFHGSPTVYAYRIFNLINNSKAVQNALKKEIKFTDDNIGVIQSLYEYVFSYDSGMHLKREYKDYTVKSIRTIEFNKLRTSYSLGKYSILSDIVGVIDDCMDTTYFYSSYGNEGGLTTQKRSKSKSRRGSEKFRNTANANNFGHNQEYRESLRERCRVDFEIPLSTESAKVTIPMVLDGDPVDIVFKVHHDKGLGILAQASEIKMMPVDGYQDDYSRIFLLFDEGSPIDLGLSATRNKLLSDKDELNRDEQLFKEILKFIDARLPTGFLSQDGLLKLNMYLELQRNSNPEVNPISDLLLYAVKSQVVSDTYYDFNNQRLDPDNKNIVSIKDFPKFLRKKYPAFANISEDDKKRYFIINNGILKLRTIPSSTQWVDIYDQATQILYEENDASTSKNQSGNNDANYVTAFLGGQIFNVCYKAIQEKNRRKSLINQGLDIPQSAASALLFTNHSGAIKLCVINSDIKNRAGTVKSIRDLQSSELFYNAIIHNFWSSFIETGEYCIQPTTYSDKVKLIQYLVDGSKYKHFNKKSLSQLTKEETIELYRTSIGEASRLALENVKYFYRQLWGKDLSVDQINSRLKTYTEDKLSKEALAKGLNAMVDFHYRKKKINGEEALMINEIVVNLAKYADAAALNNKFAEEEVHFINNLVDSGIFFYVDYHDTSLYDSSYHGLSAKEQLKKSTSPVARIIRELYLTNEEIKKYLDEWVKNGKLILAYDLNGEPVMYKNVTGISKLNPILEKYFYIDSLVSNNLRFQLTGFETNHPDKSKFTKMWENIAGGLNIENQLLSSTKNIERLQEAQIIWGHSALGKTTYLTAYPDSIIDWDAEFNPVRNKFIADVLGDSSQLARQEFLRLAYNYIKGTGDYNPNLVLAYEAYKQMLYETWEKTKQKAREQNKKIFASPTVLLELFGNDFDLVLTMDKGTFLLRKSGEADWKQSIDTLLSNPILSSKTINVGNLYMSDIMALNDSYDLYLLSRSSNKDSRALAGKLMTIIENISQGTQLKRNVIIPATMHYMHNDLMEGVAKRIKVAIIEDMPAKVFNFSGLSDKIDSMDGSAFTTMLLSILENKTLGSQEVGDDKKPIWHHYDQASGTAALMKFASFAINNERMLLSMNSTVPLIRMFKKMTNLLWSNLDLNGVPASWKTPNLREIILGKSVKFTGANRIMSSLNFINDVLDGKALYYRTYNDLGLIIYKQIIGFGGNATDGYYTIETEVNKFGMAISEKENVYHYFNSNSEHYTISDPAQKLAGDHTINSLYELWLAMGGVYSQSLGEKLIMEPSESSHFAVVGFMNKTIFPKEGAGTDRFDISQNSYEQPLKEMMIGYLTNNSGMKNGACNRNSVNRWHDGDETYAEWISKNNLVDSPESFSRYQDYIREAQLTYMEMDSDGLGVQMDADHDVEIAATMTEFSQVIAALESGGYLHKYAKQVYQDLGKVAAVASKMEIDAVTKFLAGNEGNYDEVKSELYDVLARTLLNGIKSREDLASLTDEILQAINRRFNRNLNHAQDIFKVPFSDSNIYSQILPTFISIINSKSIKRKYPGSGCVMIPGYNVIQYFKINDRKYTFNDLVPKAVLDANISGRLLPPTSNPVAFERQVVREYLEALQLSPEYERESTDEFIPTDIVNIKVGDTWTGPINLDNLDTYYYFKYLPEVLNIVSNVSAEESTDEQKALVEETLKVLNLTAEQVQNISGFRYDIRLPKNLAPVRITFEVAEGPNAGKKMNVFDLKPYRDAWLSSKTKNEELKAANQEAVQEAFRLLASGYIIDESGAKIKITNLKNMPAEMVISNMDRNKFGVGNKSIALILDEGVKAFKLEAPRLDPSKNYDLVFSGLDNSNTYISFRSPKKSSENSYDAYKESNLTTEKDDRGNINVYLTSNNNRKLFKVGRYIIKEGYSYKDGFVNNEGKATTSEEALKEGCSYSFGRFYDSLGNQISEKEALKEGFTYHQPTFYDEKGNIVRSRDRKNLRADKSTVYEYVEFVSQYKVSEKVTDEEDDSIWDIKEYDKYYINVYNVKKVFPKNTDDDETYNKSLKKFITGLLDDIYSTKLSLGIAVNPELDPDAAGNIVKYATNMLNIDSDFRTIVLQPLELELRSKLEPISQLALEINNTKDLNEKSKLLKLYEKLKKTPIEIDKSIKDKYDAFYDKLAKSRFSSWQQSLYFTAARIPAQTLQSFMLMEAVAYSGNSTNKVYVSHWQAWLQGSD